jgi:exodeoxyribonuclease V alpha subunit
MTPSLAALRAAGILSALDEHFATAMGRLGGETRANVRLAVALTSRQVANGHVCVDLPRLAAGPPLISDAGEALAAQSWPALESWMSELRSSSLVGDGHAATPFVLDDRGRLYLRRYWQHQQCLAQAIRTRATETEARVDASWLRSCLDRLFPGDTSASGEPDWQRIAAIVAVQRRFCVISGGPGTGKTFTVVKLLAVLLEQALHAGARVPHILLLAPTGKAAARLTESIRRAKTDLPCSDSIRQAIPEDAMTIHRCLGPIGESATRFRHSAANPLLADVVLVDEASMVDLALMRRLLDAIPARARVILLGDMDQLASVEAGAVLGDICNTGSTPHPYSRHLVQQIEAISGARLPLASDAPNATGIWDCVIQLTRSYRYARDSGIGALARAINAGDSAAALAILASPALPEVALAEPPRDRELSRSLRRALLEGFAPYVREHDPGLQLRALERFRVLCAHRRGPAGVETINRRIEAVLETAGLLRVRAGAYAGRPVMVTRNDYALNLFNGDVGLIVTDHADGERTRAVFAASGGRLRTLAPSRLPPHETVFAMSVHKSQGSEFDAVAVVLPERASPVVSRELLYTAVTRARHHVTIYATRDVVAHAIAHRIDRASGLRDALWDEGGSLKD